MSKWSVCIKPTEVAYVISDGNYAKVYLKDETSHLVPYTQKQLKIRFGLNLKMVRRGVYVNPNMATVKNGIVNVLNKKFKPSRRLKVIWILLFCSLYNITFAQNTAPTAINDTLLVCNDQVHTFKVTNNDYDVDGDRILLHSFTMPLQGDLVARGNQGNFRYIFGESDTTSFQYNLRDIRFAGIGSLTSNSATVKITGAPQYFYSGSYSGNNVRLTCRSSNTSSVTISGSTREINQSFTSITLDASQGTVQLSPNSSGAIELSIKK